MGVGGLKQMLIKITVLLINRFNLITNNYWNLILKSFSFKYVQVLFPKRHYNVNLPWLYFMLKSKTFPKTGDRVGLNFMAHQPFYVI